MKSGIRNHRLSPAVTPGADSGGELNLGLMSSEQNGTELPSPALDSGLSCGEEIKPRKIRVLKLIFTRQI